MGKIIYLDKLKEFLKKTPIFRSKDIQLIVKSNYSHLIIHNMIKKGEIKRVTKGWYSLHEDPVVAVLCFKPAYIGLQEALSFHELWEQETNTVIVSTRKLRTGLRRVFDSNIVLHRIDQKYFFGFDYMRYNNFFIPVSDIEKTLIDLVYFNEIPEKNVLRGIKKRIDQEKLKKYLKKFPMKFRKRVLELL